MLGGELAELGIDLTTLNEESKPPAKPIWRRAGWRIRAAPISSCAILFMSVAAARLVERDLVAALPTEREALTLFAARVLT
jgi:hypothetical protein